MKGKKILSLSVLMVIAFVSSFLLINYKELINVFAEEQSTTTQYEIHLNEPKKDGKCVQLSWDPPADVNDSYKKEAYEYRIHAIESGIDETIPANEYVNILNIYPTDGNHLKEWLREPALERVPDEEADKYFKYRKENPLTDVNEAASYEDGIYYVAKIMIKDKTIVQDEEGKDKIIEKKEIKSVLYKYIYEEVDGQVYIYTNGRGIVKAKKGVFKFGDDSEEEVTGIVPDRDEEGNLQYATFNNTKMIEKINVVNEISVQDFNNQVKEAKDKNQPNYLKIMPSNIDDRGNELSQYGPEGKYNKNVYKYDVVFLGAYDENGKENLSDDSEEAIEEFVGAGGGYLAGHDTPNSPRITQMLHLRKLSKDEAALHVFADTNLKPTTEGLLTRYPWSIFNYDKEGKLLPLYVPESHSGQVTQGHVWIKYNKNTWHHSKGIDIPNAGEMTNTSNFYLTTFSNTAMIQTGHAYNERVQETPESYIAIKATPDEKKIMANTLTYLSQITAKTSCTDIKSADELAPNAPEIESVRLKDGDVKVKLKEKVDDVPSEVEYYIEGRKVGTTDFNLKSNHEPVNLASGLRGYLVYCDKNESEEEFHEKLCDRKELTEEYFKSENIKFISAEEFNGSESDLTISVADLVKDLGKTFYVHVAAIDNAGNVSKISNSTYSIILDVENRDIDNPIKVGNKVNAELTVNNIKDITEQDVVIRYDINKLHFLGLNNIDNNIIVNYMDNIVNRDFQTYKDYGEIKLTLLGNTETNEISGKTDLLNLCFKAIDEGDAHIIIDNAIIKDKDDNERELLKLEMGSETINITK